MTLTLHLSPELEHRLKLEANRHEIAIDAYALQLLTQSLPTQQPQTTLAAQFQSWIKEGDSAEQKETGEYLLRALDEDRLADRPLFPVDKQGVTW